MDFSKQKAVNILTQGFIICSLVGTFTFGVWFKSAALSVLAIGTAFLYFAGYLVYSTLLVSPLLFHITKKEVTPANILKDEMPDNEHFSSYQDEEERQQQRVFTKEDYHPSPTHILFSHHVVSITGAAPIVGPAVALFYGWVPVVLWIVVGAVLIGAVHDLSALVMAARNEGKSVAEISCFAINRKVGFLFLLLLGFVFWLVLAAFAHIVATMWIQFPSTVLPVNAEIPVAIVLGILWRKFPSRKVHWTLSFVALILLYILIALSSWIDVKFNSPFQLKGLCTNATANPDCVFGAQQFWTLYIGLYIFVSSIAPVWILVQPRDVINGHQLLVCLILIIAGLLVLHPGIEAEGLRDLERLQTTSPPPLMPTLFITVACGAVSGVHGIIGSTVTSKQLSTMTAVRVVGYGGMLVEAFVALLTTIVVSSQWKDVDAYRQAYATFSLGSQRGLSYFTQGSSALLHALHIPQRAGEAIVGVMVVSFAATTLDTCARVQRILLNEIGRIWAQICGLGKVDDDADPVEIPQINIIPSEALDSSSPYTSVKVEHLQHLEIEHPVGSPRPRSYPLRQPSTSSANRRMADEEEERVLPKDTKKLKKLKTSSGVSSCCAGVRWVFVLLSRPMIWILRNKYCSGVVAVLPAMVAANTSLVRILWTLFGSSNQIVASLSLLTATLYIGYYSQRWWATLFFFFVPTLAVALASQWGMALQIQTLLSTLSIKKNKSISTSNSTEYFSHSNILIISTLSVALTIMGLSIWILLEGIAKLVRRCLFVKVKPSTSSDTDDVVQISHTVQFVRSKRRSNRAGFFRLHNKMEGENATVLSFFRHFIERTMEESGSSLGCC